MQQFPLPQTVKWMHKDNFSHDLVMPAEDQNLTGTLTSVKSSSILIADKMYWYYASNYYDMLLQHW